jgi:hypothetical protein
MNWDHREPTLDEMLSDSVIRAVMAADGVDPQELAVMLRQIGRSLLIRSPRRRGPAASAVRRGQALCDC